MIETNNILQDTFFLTNNMKFREENCARSAIKKCTRRLEIPIRNGELQTKIFTANIRREWILEENVNIYATESLTCRSHRSQFMYA